MVQAQKRPPCHLCRGSHRFGCDALTRQHDVRQPAAGTDRRQEVQVKPFTAGRHHRRLAARRPSGARISVEAYNHLVAKGNFHPHLMSQAAQVRVSFLELSVHHFGGLAVSPATRDTARSSPFGPAIVPPTFRSSTHQIFFRSIAAGARASRAKPQFQLQEI